MRPGSRTAWTLLLGVSFAQGHVARADPAPVTMTGVPPQIIPSYAEVGAPTFVTPSGGGSFMGDTGTSGTGTSSGSMDWTGYTSGSGSSAMDAMMATSYGALAASSATQAGVTPEAMADLGQLESGFRNVGTSNGSSSATGPWQITTGTWADTVAKYNLPYSASDITNPAAQATVASYIAKDYSNAVSEETGKPATVVQTYAAWVFGPSPGANIAVANASDPLSKYVSATNLSNNNMTGWTVGQFNANFSGKLGSSASTIVQSS
jgi:muramidase (phage lysozyme)